MVNRALAQARRLAAIRSGPGAAQLPVEYSRLRLSFASRNANGHMGPRKFAQSYLSQLAFHNPTLAITVERIPFDAEADPKNLHRPATLELYTGTQPTPAVELDVRGLHSDEILQRLLERTKAVPVVTEDASATPLTTTAAAAPATSQ